ncbi:hypothetical protein F2P81_002261 [Scophthalmus maximus]|uniref:Secreted protein n=1 Tax=Scophthalmus maximus TaxID=52904 RepID=A0A6A4TUQ1_SCOMX|nr:hypothetical protein F2P81_002261 [Scophthalmus maximus]
MKFPTCVLVMSVLIRASASQSDKHCEKTERARTGDRETLRKSRDKYWGRWICRGACGLIVRRFRQCFTPVTPLPSVNPCSARK